jgi:tetratricopeptide (TPR) repeat protein
MFKWLNTVALSSALLLTSTVCLAAQGEDVPLEELSMPQLLDLAQQNIDSGQLEESLTVLREILGRDERHILARKALIDVLMNLVRREEAWKEANILCEQYPGDPHALYMKAAVAFRRGDFQVTSELAAQAIAIDDQYVEAYRLKAFSFFLLKDYDNYKATLLQLLEKKPNDAEAYYHLGRYYYESNVFPEGIEAFKKATAIDPGLYKAYFFMGWCQQGGGDTEGAKRSFRKAAQVVQTSRVSYGWPFTDLGELLVAEGRYDEGLGWLYRGVRNDPELPYTHCKYAEALLKTEKSGEIEQHLLKAIELDPGYTQAYYLLGRYYSKAGEREKAKQALAKFQELRKNPTVSPQGVRRGDR